MITVDELLQELKEISNSGNGKMEVCIFGYDWGEYRELDISKIKYVKTDSVDYSKNYLKTILTLNG